MPKAAEAKTETTEKLITSQPPVKMLTLVLALQALPGKANLKREKTFDRFSQPHDVVEKLLWGWLRLCWPPCGTSQ